ncbi:hypothetical protein [Halobaculum sp. D14]|uniref:hypothetical protein n=1 Tax=Halobaculum sp. D14 TaxID=3421642 RepID=UPI003EBBED12
MVRSPRSQTALLAALAALALLTAAAFAPTFGSALTWQNRDTVSVSAEQYTVDGGETPTMTVTFAVDNPTRRRVTVVGASLVAYDGPAPHGDDAALTVPRSASVPRTTVPAGDTGTVTVVMDVSNSGVDRARQAVRSGRADVSGSLRLQLAGREFDVDV